MPTPPSHRPSLLRNLCIGILCLGIIPLVGLWYRLAPPTHREEGKLLVVVTTGMLADAMAHIGQDKVTVKALMGPGVDPHAYRVTLHDSHALMEADIVLYHGLHLEGAMDEVLRTMAQGTSAHVYAVSDALDPDDILQDTHFSAGKDPHAWHSVLLWKKVVVYVSEQLQREDPAHADWYEANTQAYLAELDALHAYIVASIATIPPHARVLVTAHDAFGYLGRDYGLQVESLLGISTVAQSSVRDIEDLKAFIMSHGIHAVFPETSVPSKGIQAVIESCRQESYVVTAYAHLYSDALGDPNGPAGTYIGMMRTNIDHIVTAAHSSP